MSSESKKRKINPRHKKGVAFDGGKVYKMKGVAKYSSTQRRQEERLWRKEI